MSQTNITITAQLFTLGQLVATPGSLEVIREAEGVDLYAVINRLLNRHVSGDWGDLDADDKAANDKAVLDAEDRILSAYNLKNGARVWIITEWDRSVTTVLLPEEY